jgi:eukaryotic-like serine/threonine-protein kinase
MSFLGEALLAQKKYAEAEQTLLKSYEGLTTHRFDFDDRTYYRTTETLDLLIRLYTETDKPDAAAKYRNLRSMRIPLRTNSEKK